MSTTVGIKLDARMQQRLKKLGSIKDRSPHWLMKEAIARYLDIEERIEQERSEDLARYERFVATGEHIPNDQMMLWLDGLATGASRAGAPRAPRHPARSSGKRSSAKR